MCRNQWRWGLLAGVVTCTWLCVGTARTAFAQTVVAPTVVADPDEIHWSNAVRDFRETNPLAGTVIIRGKRWTPALQAADPAAFRAALADADARVNSPEYIAAKKLEMERIAEAQRATRERRYEEMAFDRQERQAKLNFDWNRYTQWQLVDYAVPLKFRELEAQAAANAMALQATKVSVVQSPGAVTQPTAVQVTPELKTRIVNRFLAGGEPLTKIAMDYQVPPQQVKQWVREVLK